jgi:hypothetical protein
MITEVDAADAITVLLQRKDNLLFISCGGGVTEPPDNVIDDEGKGG